MKIALTRLIQEEKHPAPSGHPENPERMKHAIEYVLDSDIAADIDVINPTTTNTDCIYNVHQKDTMQ